MMTIIKKLGNLVSENSPSLSRFNRKIIMLFSCLVMIFLAQTPVFADTETSADITEKSAGASHTCLRSGGACTYDPRSDINSDSGSDDDVIYWDRHGKEFSIMNDISTFLTEEQMLQGFTMDSSV